MSKNNRTERITVRFTKEEVRELKNDRNVSEVVRQLLFSVDRD